MPLGIGVACFITTILLIEGAYYALRAVRGPERKRIQRRLRALAAGAPHTEGVDIVRRRVLSEVPFLNRFLSRASGIRAFERILGQTNSAYPVGVFLLLSLLLALLGFLLGAWVSKHALLTIFGMAVGGMLPFLYVSQKRKQRILRFQSQLPDALDLVARALRVGHGIMVSMKMVADEFPDPIGAEFDKTIDTINVGVGVPEALMGLAQRVDCPDLRFFVTSILIQRETGGNLAEIVENISHLIRQRFELQGRIRVLAAEGKLSAIILLALPFLVALALFGLNPDYLRVLFADPIGKAMLGTGLCMMGLGTFVIRTMIQIKV